MTTRTLLAAAGLLAAASTPVGAEALSYEGRLRIGATGIMCVKEPCPRIGIRAEPEPGGVRLGRPMFAGKAPPPMEGRDADLDRVRAAWTIEGCVIVEGRFSRPPLLEIDRVVGDCRDER